MDSHELFSKIVCLSYVKKMFIYIGKNDNYASFTINNSHYILKDLCKKWQLIKLINGVDNETITIGNNIDILIDENGFTIVGDENFTHVGDY